MLARRLLVPLLLAALAALPACKSADELYNEGQDLELRGRYLEAAHRYADALEKQPDLQKARGRLLEAGKLAAGQQLARIDAAATEAEAADHFLDLDRLLGRAAGLGVTIPVPENYADARRATFDAAVDELLAAADAEAARGRFPDALARLDRARRYRPDSAQAAALDAAAADTFLAWSEADLAAGRFRSAHEHAGAALALVGVGADVREAALALQAAAVERGSVRAALLPLWRTRAAAEALPDGFLDDLNDLLDHEHWSRPPLFVRVAHPADVGRALRHLNLQRRALSVAEAADVGRFLDAHLVLAGEVDRFARAAEVRRREAREARTLGGDRVTYDRVEEDVTLRAGVAFEVVDPRRLDTVCERSVEHAARGRVVRGEYGGSLRTLQLSRSERRLFDADEIARQEREIEADLLEGLARRVAEAAFECVARAVR